MLIEDHRLRVARLLRFERRITDFDRLFADLRLAKPGRSSVREIGHFAAHRGERESGIVLERVNEIQISARLWFKQSEGYKPTLEDICAAGTANLNIASDEQIRQLLHTSRQAARTLFRKGVGKLKARQSLNKKERNAVNAFGFTSAWQYAFDDAELLRDFGDLLVSEGSLTSADRSGLDAFSNFISLYALAIMHGAHLKMPDGSTAQLSLAASYETGALYIKADIPVGVILKPIKWCVPIFVTRLPAAGHCDLQLLEAGGRNIPAEVKDDRLTALACRP